MVKIYSNGVYPIKIALSDDAQSIERKYKCRLEEIETAVAVTYPILKKRVVAIVFNRKTIEERTMAHEAFHAACSIAQYAYMPLGKDSEEAYAYLITWIVDCMCDFKRRLESQQQ